MFWQQIQSEKWIEKSFWLFEICIRNIHKIVHRVYRAKQCICFCFKREYCNSSKITSLNPIFWWPTYQSWFKIFNVPLCLTWDDFISNLLKTVKLQLNLWRYLQKDFLSTWGTVMYVDKWYRKETTI